jgi:hypothetical protein
MAPVTTGQIYWGAVPFVVLQVVMVALVIAFPQMVMVYKGTAPVVDPSQVEILLPPVEAPPTPPADDIGGAFGAGAPAGPPQPQGGNPGQPPSDLTDLFK